MSLPRRTPELAELLSAGTGPGSELRERADDHAPTSDVRLASDEAVERAIKRITRDHRDLMTALAK